MSCLFGLSTAHRPAVCRTSRANANQNEVLPRVQQCTIVKRRMNRYTRRHDFSWRYPEATRSGVTPPAPAARGFCRPLCTTRRRCAADGPGAAQHLLMLAARAPAAASADSACNVPRKCAGDDRLRACQMYYNGSHMSHRSSPALAASCPPCPRTPDNAVSDIEFLADSGKALWIGRSKSDREHR